MANGDDYEGLKQAAGGDVKAMADLLGETFTLVDFEDIQTRFLDERTGANRTTHIARIVLEGEEDEIRCWMGGVVVNRQLAWLKTTGRLPMRIKLGGKGNQESPYELEEPDTKPKVAKPKSKTTARDVTCSDPLDYFRTGDGNLDSKAFVQWWGEQGLTSNDLAGVIGKPTMTALEAWFEADMTRTVQTLLEEATGETQPPWAEDKDELPFE